MYFGNNVADTADEFCYYVRAKGWNPDEYSGSTKICIEQPAVVYIPNSFSRVITPEVNGAFGPEGLSIEDYTIENKKWDGTFRIRRLHVFHRDDWRRW